MKPEAEVSIGLATAVFAYGTYQLALPSTADIRSLEPNNRDIQGSERTAAWVAAGGVALTSLLLKSPTIFTIGGLAVIASSWMTRHADQVSTVSKKASSLVPAPATGSEGVVGDQVAAAQHGRPCRLRRSGLRGLSWPISTGSPRGGTVARTPSRSGRASIGNSLGKR
ncbi:hypothetical protein E4K10_49900 [Streptomyces sp. T1317-0309]|nr:hypothetical protein E4K10_49900 [Streptomyces sp. T1317-0309]